MSEIPQHELNKAKQPKSIQPSSEIRKKFNSTILDAEIDIIDEVVKKQVNSALKKHLSFKNRVLDGAEWTRGTVLMLFGVTLGIILAILII